MKISDSENDLMRRFASPSQFSPKSEDGAEEEIELSLGLSLNGRFGVDPKKLSRSSSVVDFSAICRGAVKEEVAPLMRTCSLPAETEEEWRRRKDLQTLRRMEVKRKRTEKQVSLRSLKRCSGGEENSDEFGGGCGGFEGFPPQAPSSQGSIGSLRSGSSGVSDFDCRPIQVMDKRSSDTASPSSAHSLTESEHKTPATAQTTITKKRSELSGVVLKNAAENHGVAGKEAKNVMRSVLETMPCVSTTGEGPNGVRIEGFLYRYSKGEEVKIVCVCHGSFLSPAEFVKHAGGGDVENPLKHIVVSSSFL